MKNNIMKIYIAPMSGITDFAYRQILKSFKPDLMYTEMVNSTLFTRENKKTLKSIMRMSNDEITGIQLFGSDMNELYTNFCKLNEMGYHDLLLNMGCSKPKILKHGSGAQLLDRIDDIYLLLSKLNKVNIKISLKIRLNDMIDEYIDLANDLKIPYLCIHTRTKDDDLKTSKSNFEELKRLSKIERNFDLIANGGIYTLDDYLKIKSFNIDGIMLAQGIIGNPWLINEIRNEKKEIITLDIVKKTLINHINLIKEDKGIKKASIEINKFIEPYFKNFKINSEKIILEENFSNKIKLIEQL